MKTWQKATLASFVVAVIGAVALALAIYWYVTKTIPDLYAQWAISRDGDCIPKGEGADAD